MKGYPRQVVAERHFRAANTNTTFAVIYLECGHRMAGPAPRGRKPQCVQCKLGFSRYADDIPALPGPRQSQPLPEPLPVPAHVVTMPSPRKKGAPHAA